MDGDPAALLAQVAERYATLRSYRDEGEVVQVFLDPSRSPEEWDPERVVAEGAIWEAQMRSLARDEMGRTAYLRESPRSVKIANRKPFVTYFTRPDRFRFEFRDNPSPFDGRPESEWSWCGAWLEKGVARSWWTLRPTIQEHPSIFAALAGPHGISSGASTNIPKLLMPGSTARSVLPQPEFVSAVRDDNGCHRIECVPTGPTRLTLWIDQESLLVRRLWFTNRFTRDVRSRVREQVRTALESTEFREQISPEARRRILESDRAFSEGPEFVTETVTNYRPEADVEIEEEAFVVVIPSGKPG